MKILLIANDNLLEVLGLQNAATDDYINSATVTATLYEANGSTEVTGQSWPTTLAYVSASNGDYRGTFEDGLSLSENKRYVVDIDVDAGSDLIANWRFKATAKYRQPEE